jgi:hypothetical protein
MIDRTNTNIEELEAEIRRDNDRRYAFQRLLRATDAVLWRLEEMNRDGVKALSQAERSDIKTSLDELPQPCLDLFRDTEKVQDVLDSVFEIQERLFKLRYPELGFDEDDDSLAS